jgi:pimeloyl-ACP methyl ester carboxylesterase
LIPAWVDRREYPFEPRTLDVDRARLSYLDEGEGAPIVMVHGTPTWGVSVRVMRRPVADRRRYTRDVERHYLKAYLPRWREVFERAEVVELPDCGHAPPDERAPETLRSLAPFLER